MLATAKLQHSHRPALKKAMFGTTSTTAEPMFISPTAVATRFGLIFRPRATRRCGRKILPIRSNRNQHRQLEDPEPCGWNVNCWHDRRDGGHQRCCGFQRCRRWFRDQQRSSCKSGKIHRLTASTFRRLLMPGIQRLMVPRLALQQLSGHQMIVQQLVKAIVFLLVVRQIIYSKFHLQLLPLQNLLGCYVALRKT